MNVDYYPLIAAGLAMFIAQLSKPFFLFFRKGKIDLFQILAAGGFPSSHTSTMSAMALAFGLRDGFSTPQFTISLVLTGIIAYDAMNVRLYAGKHIQLTKQLIDDLKELTSMPFEAPIYLQKMKNILGHERFEVLGGLALGLIISYLSYLNIK